MSITRETVYLCNKKIIMIMFLIIETYDLNRRHFYNKRLRRALHAVSLLWFPIWKIGIVATDVIYSYARSD